MLHLNQARRQDVAAGGAKNEKEGPKMRRGDHILKIQYWMYAATGGPNVKWGGRAPLAPPVGDDPDLNSQAQFGEPIAT